MNFVKNLNAFGVDGKEVPCLTGHGVPTFDTQGAVGLLYIDEDTGKMYKCIAVNGTKYTWVIADGKSAYEYAKEAGYTGTEEEWAEMIAKCGIHIGPSAPTDKNIKVWIDTDEEAAELDGTAAVGQIFMVTEVDAEGKPVKWKAVDLPKAETPDYTANEGEPGYIKNRYFKIDEKGVIHKLPNMFIDADWMATKQDGGAGKTVFIPEQTVSDGLWKNLQADLVEADVYAVEVNGVLYKCQCLNDGDGTLYLGNGTLLGATVHNNEPFCISWFIGTGGTFYNDGTLEAPIGIKVTNWLDVVYNKLPEEYLPENVVKGEGGVLSWGKLSGRPLVGGIGTLLLSYTATFSTDAEAKAGVYTGASITPNLNAVYWLEVNGDVYNCHLEQSSSYVHLLYDSDHNQWGKLMGKLVYVYGQTAGTFTYKLYEASEEFVLDPQYIPPNVALKKDIPDAVVNPAAAVGQTIIVKEVDENGKPTKWESADYQPRTHWSEEANIVVIPEQTPEYSEEDGILVAFPKTEIEGGVVYKVVWNGTAYEVTAVALDAESAAIGNMVFIDGEDTGEPFLLLSTGGVVAVLTGDEQITVSVTTRGEEVHKLPAKYGQYYFLNYVYTGGTIADLAANDSSSDSHTVGGSASITDECMEVLLNGGSVVVKITDTSTDDFIMAYATSWVCSGGAVKLYANYGNNMLSLFLKRNENWTPPTT